MTKHSISSFKHFKAKDINIIKMAQSPVVFAVVPTFNRASMLQKCIDTLLHQSYPIKKIVIVNSGSTDTTNELLAKYDSRVYVINGEKTWWWAKCMNAGIIYSLKNGAEYILAMNDDTYLYLNALEYLLQTSSAFPESIIGSIVKDRNNRGQMVNRGVGAKYTKYRWIPYKKAIGRVNGRDIYYTEGHSGRGVLFPVSVYKKIGFYDTKNFIHRGDRDFSFRCYKSRIGQYLDSGATVMVNFNTTYLGIENKRLTLLDVKKILFHINGLYNIKYQYRFLHKHYTYSWPFWFAIWIVFVFIVCSIRMCPTGTKIVKKLKPKNWA